MKFDTLKERMLYYKGLSDYRLLPNGYVIVQIDGRSFSTKIKKKFKRPFDATFISYMNQVAAYVCKEVQGCKFAYVQSDEISFVLADFENPKTDSFYGYRLRKLQSIIASLATAKFNQLMMLELVSTPCSTEDLVEIVKDATLYQFDCAAFNVPTYNDTISWILYRQIDCIRNSKEGAAQTYVSHNKLYKKTSDEQIEILKDEQGIDWHEYNDGEKFGRFIWKEVEHHDDPSYGEYDRSIWRSHDAWNLTNEEGREKLKNLNLIPKQ